MGDFRIDSKNFNKLNRHVRSILENTVHIKVWIYLSIYNTNLD